MAVVLRHLHILVALFVVDDTHRSHVGDVLRADDDTAGVYAYLAVGVFELFGVGQHLLQLFVVALHDGLQLGHVFVAVLQVHLRTLAVLIFHIVGEAAVGDIGLQLVDNREGYLLHASHIGYRAFGGHSAIGDDVRHTFFAVLMRHPVEHLAASGIVEVDVDIGQRDTIRV